jgi:cytosine deaminase
MGTVAEQAEVLKILTEYPARLLRLTAYGLAVGCQADLVVWDTQRADEIAATLASPRFVVKRGRLSVEHERTVREPWRALVS